MMAIIAGISVQYSCKNKDKVIYLNQLLNPDIASIKHPKLLTTVTNVIVLNNSGYGSTMVQDPIHKAVFYLLTDKGLNVVEVAANSIMIATPDFVPQIWKFR